jgi:hypothetical protein
MIYFRFLILIFLMILSQAFSQGQKPGARNHAASNTQAYYNKDTALLVKEGSNGNKEKNFQDVYMQLSRLLDEKKFSAFAFQMRKAQRDFPANIKLLELKRQFVIKDYQNSILNAVQLPVNSYFDKKPVFSSCQPGIVNAAGHQLVLGRINYARRLAGLYDSCIFDPALNAKSQQSAMMMDANNMLDHSPKSSWKCYSKEGAAAAGSSNLSLGYSFGDAIIGQLEDGGTGNGSCGHRRWILNPYNAVYGHGSTFNASTLYVFGSNDPKLARKTGFNDSQYICWPAADFFPLDLMPGRWSFGLANADFNQAKVTVTLNGQSVKVKIEPVKNGYAINTLVWTVDQQAQANQVYIVTISQVRISTSWGRAATGPFKTYRYQFIPLEIK